jgi:molecular chaperone GrpE
VEREEILRRFEGWLDRVLAAEEPPAGVSAEILAALSAAAPATSEAHGDLYSMWAAVTSLTQEVKLQGRSFKQLSETVAPVAELAPDLVEMKREAQDAARREMLDVLLDLRDRLGRGIEAARASQAAMKAAQSGNWLTRLLPGNDLLRQTGEQVAALIDGYRLSLAHLDEVLTQFDVRRIDCQGQPFNPGTMNVIDVEETDQADEGTVVEVYRAGYEWRGEVCRPAQVKVARKPNAILVEEGKDG